ncbi:hypothetical protein SELMODRAFT_429587 [Selaginella moellendorffii]|uniref:Uncharacterized protein n=1 Tax=Selaginella moellendorffii TaxID=88036 RepID=D8T6N6_SELML|nr:hypothetical protein SELMODRAFT_429587 [Selaginella moellendorffii]
MAMLHAPTPACFASVLAACVHRGALELATSYFAAMVRDHGVTPGRQHYGCMVDLMGRAGRVDDARHIVAAMPCHVDALDWRCLLGACRWSGTEGDRCGTDVAGLAMGLDPGDAAAYDLCLRDFLSGKDTDRWILWKPQKRREGTDVEDLFISHIADMDAMARELHNAAKILEEGTLPSIVKERYASFDSAFVEIPLKDESTFSLVIVTVSQQFSHHQFAQLLVYQFPERLNKSYASVASVSPSSMRPPFKLEVTRFFPSGQFTVHLKHIFGVGCNITSLSKASFIMDNTKV